MHFKSHTQKIKFCFNALDIAEIFSEEKICNNLTHWINSVRKVWKSEYFNDLKVSKKTSIRYGISFQNFFGTRGGLRTVTLTVEKYMKRLEAENLDFV